VTATTAGTATTPLQGLGGRLAIPVNDQDHILGPAQAPVTLLEYGDYQCPYCGAVHPVVQEILRRRPEQVRFVYRHFPIANVHPYAEPAAEAAEAADRRQRFWPMHDWLFDHQDRLHPAYLRLGAEEVGLPAEVVDREVGSHAYLDRVQRDFIGGIRSGVNGTPAFYINGLRHDGGHTLAELLAAVDTAAGRDTAEGE
jgi:protein-disulfide isomerase